MTNLRVLESLQTCLLAPEASRGYMLMLPFSERETVFGWVPSEKQSEPDLVDLKMSLSFRYGAVLAIPLFVRPRDEIFDRYWTKNKSPLEQVLKTTYNRFVERVGDQLHYYVVNKCSSGHYSGELNENVSQSLSFITLSDLRQSELESLLAAAFILADGSLGDRVQLVQPNDVGIETVPCDC